MTRIARVKRIIITEYDVPVEYYSADGEPTMGEESIREIEMAEDQDVGVLLDNIRDEIVQVTFHDDPADSDG